MDYLSSEVIKEKLKHDFCVSVFDEIDSTSTYLLSVTDKGTPNGTTILANHQTRGRGRRGKSFFSPEKTGLYFSFLFKPEKNLSPAEITLTAAVSVAAALESILGVNPKIKWVNDIFLDGRKVSGILTEMHRIEDVTFYIIGIGINVYEPKESFPEDIKSSAGYLLSSEMDNLKNCLSAEIINNFFSYSENMDFGVILSEYSSRLLAVGKEVKVLSEPPYSAVLNGINEKGELIVTKKNGEKALLSSGEISIVL
jgi:BirA family biotin operon repressor/biotin-[acetyl-CoA-carboxylase] ligase